MKNIAAVFVLAVSCFGQQLLKVGTEMTSGSVGIILMPWAHQLEGNFFIASVRTDDPLTTRFRIVAKYRDSESNIQENAQTITRDSSHPYSSTVFMIPLEELLSIRVEELKSEAFFTSKITISDALAERHQ